jgi:hypothetical protein
MALPVMDTFVYSESFLVNLLSGLQILMKSLTCDLKNLQTSTKDLIFSFVVGTFVVSTALSLLLPDLILLGVNLNPR